MVSSSALMHLVGRSETAQHGPLDVHVSHAGMTPLVKMHTLGHDFIPDPIHAGGLRYHGMAPLVSHMYDIGESAALWSPHPCWLRRALAPWFLAPESAVWNFSNPHHPV